MLTRHCNCQGQSPGFTKIVVPMTLCKKCTKLKSINQSINLYLSRAKAHTNTHTHTPTQKTTTMYNKRNKKETVEKKHTYIVRCQIQLIFLTRLFTEQFNLVVRRTRALWSRVEKHGNPSSKSITVTLLNFA